MQINSIRPTEAQKRLLKVMSRGVKIVRDRTRDDRKESSIGYYTSHDHEHVSPQLIRNCIASGWLETRPDGSVEITEEGRQVTQTGYTSFGRKSTPRVQYTVKAAKA